MMTNHKLPLWRFPRPAAGKRVTDLQLRAWGRRRREAGFTLIEAIIVITITAIISAVVAVFIRAPVEGYMDSVARAELTDIADTALRRMARDIRLALPNSVRVSGNYLELLQTKTGGRYLREEDGVSGNILRFEGANCTTTPADCTFDVVGNMPSSEQKIVSGDYIVVYNLGPGQDPADAYNCTGAAPNRICNRAQVSGTPSGNTITLADNPFSNWTLSTAPGPMKSPSGRFQVVSGPVTYFCDGTASGGSGQLRRYANYTIQTAQPLNVASAPLSGASMALLATGVISCAFAYQDVKNTHSGLISLSISMQVPNSSSGIVTLTHQVHVDNTP
jgi:MSHA biogenesis protein MshO